MSKALVMLALVAALLAQAGPDDATAPPATAPADASVRFGALDVFVDTGEEPLAAYQVEWKVTAGDVTLVGIEGGEHAAYKEPPHYDPKALSGGRVIVGAFNTGSDLPHGRTRVARLMVRVRGDVAPAYAATVQAAAGADARAIPARVSVSEHVEKTSWHGRPAHDSQARNMGGPPVQRATPSPPYSEERDGVRGRLSRVQEEEPLTLALSPEYRGEGKSGIAEGAER